MSSQSNKTLHTLPFFDSVFDYEALKLQFLEKSQTNTKNEYSANVDELEKEGIIESPKDYNEEGTVFCDIQNQIVNRIKAGYMLEAIDRNVNLSMRFRGYQETYSLLN